MIESIDYMEEHTKEIIELYKNFIKIFNEYIPVKDRELNYNNYKYLTDIYRDLTDLLLKNKIIENYGIKNHRIIESGEII